MFDVGFSEIVLIAVVALIVIGPKDLPRTARMLGHLFARLQRYVSEVKADINREMELDELRRLQNEVKSAASDIERSVQSVATDFRAGVRNVEQQLNEGASSSAAPSSPPAPSSVEAPTQASQQPSLPGIDKA